MNTILDILRENSDAGYAAFTARLIPNIPAESVLGVRSPDLKRIAKTLLGARASSPAQTGTQDSVPAASIVGTQKPVSAAEGYANFHLAVDIDAFLNDLPHYYLEENNLHALLISKAKDFGQCLAQTEKFLPYINNWATCDTFSPDCFAKHKKDLVPYIDKWLQSGEAYTIRFAIGMLMRHFLDGDFRKDYMRKVAKIRHEDYYVRMMQAWYFATALAKQYDIVLKYLPLLDDWTRRKAIQKARESYRITAEQKQELLNYK